MLSAELEFCLNEAFQKARDNRHEFLTVEHLLLALAIDESGESWVATGRPVGPGDVTVTVSYVLRGEPFEIEGLAVGLIRNTMLM